MRKVIRKKVYDTATATRLARSDFGTELYRTANGAYFVAHWDHCGNNRHSVEPLSVDAAIELYERLDNPFAHPLNDEGRIDSSRSYVSFEEAFPQISVKEA